MTHACLVLPVMTGLQWLSAGHFLWHREVRARADISCWPTMTGFRSNGTPITHIAPNLSSYLFLGSALPSLLIGTKTSALMLVCIALRITAGIINLCSYLVDMLEIAARDYARLFSRCSTFDSQLLGVCFSSGSILTSEF